MGIRFRRSVKLAPGIRMNFSGSGVSWSFGTRGASVTIGKRGTYLNTGIPGTGLYTRQKIGNSIKVAKSTNSNKQAQQFSIVNVSVGVRDDGTIFFQDNQGSPLPESLIAAAKKQHGVAIKDLILKKCDEINDQIEAISKIHLGTSPPTFKPMYQLQIFDLPTPTKPILTKKGLLSAIFNSRKVAIAKHNIEISKAYLAELENWRIQKEIFDNQEQKRKYMIEHSILTELNAMEKHLELCLHDITWPRETIISFEILNSGASILIDVDLPEIEDMPSKVASAPTRGYMLNVKDMPASKIRQLYLEHINGVGFRIIGETFAALPTAQVITLSGYTQRASSNTGQINNDYIYSARVKRTQWENINFNNLQAIDVVKSLEQFDLRRNIGSDGTLFSIEPF